MRTPAKSESSGQEQRIYEIQFGSEAGWQILQSIALIQWQLSYASMFFNLKETVYLQVLFDVNSFESGLCVCVGTPTL